MAFRHKLALSLFIVGLIVLGAASAVYYWSLCREAELNQASKLQMEAAELSKRIDQVLRERTNTAITLANSPLIISFLMADNIKYESMSPGERAARIKDLDEKWAAARKENHPFVQAYLNNPVADLLKKQQTLFPGEYGELFLTNRYGALVGSTAKLTTFSHSHKYWWQGAYDGGKGAVFLDDRGYDLSAGGYVMGLVIPVKRNDRVIGLLKCNLNILGFITRLVGEADRWGGATLARSGGLIVCQPGSSPLSQRVEEPIRLAMEKTAPGQLRIAGDQGVDQVALWPVSLSTGQPGFIFGGSFESVDHQKGNTGEIWFVVFRQSVSVVQAAIRESIKPIILIGALLLGSLVAASFFVGRRLTKPLTVLSRGADRVGRGDLSARVESNSRDELGRLAESFNRMVEDLQSSMASRLDLETAVAELKQAEEKLKESSIRWQYTFDAISDIICLLSPDQTILQINQAGCRAAGLNLEELIGRKCFEVIHHPNPPMADNPCIASLASGRYEVREYEEAGRYFELEAWPVIGSEGRIESITHIIRDVTARKKAEIELANSEETYRLLAENPNIVVFKFDPEGKVTFCNRYATELFGYTAEEIIGRRTADLICPKKDSDGRDVEDFWADLIENTKKYEIHENENITKDGARLWISWTNTSVYNDQGELVELISTGVNATDRQEAKQRLQESEERFRTVVENINAAIYVVENGHYIFSNRAGCDMIGLAPDQIISRPISEFIPPDEIDWIADRHRRRLNGQIIDDIIEHRLISVDGSEIWIQTLGTLINWRGSEAILAFAVDITPRKMVEFEKERLESQLLQAQKMEALGTLAGGIAHDFNNILAAIIGYSELALEDAREGRVDDEQIGKILAAGLRAKDLVTQILTFSRKVEPDMKPANLNRVVTQTEEMIARIIPKMVSVEHRLADDLWLVNADAGQIGQVLMNLCSNANDAMPDGGRLIIETGNIFFDKEYCRQHAGITPGDYVVITVSDTGQGMDRETLKRIFEPFFTSKDIGKGTGLGLAMAYGIIRNHGGHIHCYSEPGSGTEFKVYLPALRADQSEKEIAEESSGPVLDGDETILLVDDEATIRDLAVKILSRRGYEVITAGSGEEALDVYDGRGSEIDLIILDISMPGMGGRRCLEKLLEIDPRVKVIISSGYSRSGRMSDIIATGAVDFIPKPFSPKDVLRAIRKALDSDPA